MRAAYSADPYSAILHSVRFPDRGRQPGPAEEGEGANSLKDSQGGWAGDHLED